MNMKVYKKVAVIAAAMLAVFSWDVRGTEDSDGDLDLNPKKVLEISSAEVLSSDSSLNLKKVLEISRTEESKMKAGEESLEGQLKIYFESEDGKGAIGTVLKEQLTSYFGNEGKGAIGTVLKEQLTSYFGNEGKTTIKGGVKEGLNECFSEESPESSGSSSPPPSCYFSKKYLKEA